MTSAFYSQNLKKMNAKELMQPRFKVISDYPDPKDHPYFKIGEVINTITDEDVFYFEKYSDLFKKLNWFEERKKEDMPKKLICKAIPNDTEIMEIEEWDMDIMVGWTNKEKRECCSLFSFNYEYGYFPVD